MKTKFTALAALILVFSKQTAIAGGFLFIPPAVTEGTRAYFCLGPNAKVGDEIKSVTGDILTVNLIWGRYAGCKQPERPVLAQLESSGSERFATKIGLELPDYYEQIPLTDGQQLDGGVLLATHGATDTGIYVTSVRREMVPDLDAYATRMGASLEKLFTVAHQTNIETLKIDGLEARRFETEGKIHGTSRTYVGTLLQGDNEVIWVNGWAPTSQYGRFKSELIHVSESVVGLHAAAPLQSADAPLPPRDVAPQRDVPSEVSAAAGTVAPKITSDQQKPDIAERLRKLRDLYRDGLIEQQDYEAKKAEILKTL